MSDPRWSEATEELLARELLTYANAADEEVAPRGRVVGYDEEEQEVRDACLDGARQFLAALVDAGLLVPPGAEVAKQWSVNWFDIETRQPMATSATNDRAEADRSLDDLDEVWGHHARLMTRNVISTPWNKVTP